MKKFVFCFSFFFLLTVGLFPQASFMAEKRSFSELGVSTNKDMQEYLRMSKADFSTLFETEPNSDPLDEDDLSLSPFELYTIFTDLYTQLNLNIMQLILENRLQNYSKEAGFRELSKRRPETTETIKYFNLLERMLMTWNLGF
jgi:hypothetical protein